MGLYVGDTYFAELKKEGYHGNVRDSGRHIWINQEQDKDFKRHLLDKIFLYYLLRDGAMSRRYLFC